MALDQVNDTFHQAYDQRREEKATNGPPVLLVLADTVTLLVDDTRTAVRFTPELFHVIKSVVHAPVAAFAAARSPERLLALRAHLETSLHELDGYAAEPEVLTRLRALLRSTRSFVEAALAGHGPAREVFAASTGLALLASTDDATGLQLAALDGVVSELLGRLPADARAELQVVVAGAHQARAQSLGMQYFGKLLGARADAQLTYAESIESEEEALRLIRTRQLDREIASAFFGEPTRLERDVLGDAVKKRLVDYQLAAAALMP